MERTEEWIVGMEERDGRKYHMCSGCSAFANSYSTVKKMCEWLTPYCPYCGAPMRNGDTIYQWIEGEEYVQ